MAEARPVLPLKPAMSIQCVDMIVLANTFQSTRQAYYIDLGLFGFWDSIRTL